MIKEDITRKVKNLENIRPKGLMTVIVNKLLDGEEIPETEFLSNEPEIVPYTVEGIAELMDDEEIPETEFLQNVSDTDENELEIVHCTAEGIVELMEDNSTVEEFDRFEEKEKQRRIKNPEYAKHQEELQELLDFVDSLN